MDEKLSASLLEEELFSSEDCPDLPEYISSAKLKVKTSSNSGVKSTPVRAPKPIGLSPMSQKVFSGEMPWYNLQIQLESSVLERQLARKVQMYQNQLADNPKLLEKRQEGARLACLREIEVRLQLLKQQLQDEKEVASKVLQELQTERMHLHGDPNQPHCMKGTEEDNLKEPSMSRSQSQQSEENYEHPLRKLFYGISGEESSNQIVTGAVSCKDLDKAMEHQFRTMFQQEERNAKAFLAAYLQCILKVPLKQMSEDVQGMHARIAGLVGCHTLGHVMFAFIRVFRGLYDGVQHNAEAVSSLTGQATEDLHTFMGYLHQQLEYKWQVLQSDFRALEISLECIHRAVFRHIPEIQFMFQATHAYSDEALVRRMNKLVAAHKNGGLLEEFNVPTDLRLHNLDLLTRDPLEMDNSTAQAYGRSIECLQNLSEAKSPPEKAQQVVLLCRITCQSVQNYYTARNETAPAVAADDLLPLLSFIVVKAFQAAPDKVRYLHAEVEFIDALMPQHMKNAEEGYCLATLASVLADLSADRPAQTPFATVVGIEDIARLNESINRGEESSDNESLDITQLDTALRDLGQDHILVLGTSDLAEPLLVR